MKWVIFDPPISKNIFLFTTPPPITGTKTQTQAHLSLLLIMNVWHYLTFLSFPVTFFNDLTLIILMY